LGKAYLSCLPDERLTEKIEKIALKARTEKSIVEKNALWAELRKTRDRRYSMSEEEYIRGLIAIGAPLVDPVSGEGVGAVSFDFSILQHNAAEVEAKYRHLIVETARTLSELLPVGRDRLTN
jgi:DNA-binding IclR family transcriptional regulator